MTNLKETKTIEDREEAVESTLLELRRLDLKKKISLDVLDIITPKGYRPVVELLEGGRKKRRTASADSWSPETGEILISFEPCEAAQWEETMAADPQGPEVAKAEFTCPECGKRVEAREQVELKGDIVLILSCKHAILQKDVKKVEPEISSLGRKKLVPFRKTGEEPLGNVSAVPAASTRDETLSGLLEALEEAENTPGRMFVAFKWFRDEFLPSTGLAWAQNHDERQALLAKAIQDGWILTGKVPNPKAPFYPTTTVRVNRQKQPSSPTTSRFHPVPISGEPLSHTILRDRGER